MKAIIEANWLVSMHFVKHQTSSHHDENLQNFMSTLLYFTLPFIDINKISTHIALILMLYTTFFWLKIFNGFQLSQVLLKMKMQIYLDTAKFLFSIAVSILQIYRIIPLSCPANPLICSP